MYRSDCNGNDNPEKNSLKSETELKSLENKILEGIKSVESENMDQILSENNRSSENLNCSSAMIKLEQDECEIPDAAATLMELANQSISQSSKKQRSSKPNIEKTLKATNTSVKIKLEPSTTNPENQALIVDSEQVNHNSTDF